MTTLRIYHGAEKPIVAVGTHQTLLLSFAFAYRGWHTYAKDRTTVRAIRGLQNRACIEVSGDQFRFTYPKVAA